MPEAIERSSTKGGNTSPAHSVVLEGRHHLDIVGVTHVDSFTDGIIVLSTLLGTLTIKGHGLRIQQVDLDTTRVVADGDVDGLQYSRRRPPAGDGTLWQRLWR